MMLREPRPPKGLRATLVGEHTPDELVRITECIRQPEISSTANVRGADGEVQPDESPPARPYSAIYFVACDVALA